MQNKTPQEIIRTCYENMLVSIEPDNLFRHTLSLKDDQLFYRDRPVELSAKGNLVMAGAGKAAVKMGHAIIPFLPKFPDDTLFVSPSEDSKGFLNVMLGDHPHPGQKSYDAGYEMLRLILSLKENDTLIFLISGGASSLMAFPQPGCSMRELNIISHILQEYGMTIEEINTVRQHLSKIKGGKLAKICKARILVFYISDVTNDNISVIGSGPFAKPLEMNVESVLRKYGIDKKIPKKMLRNLLAEPLAKDIPVVPHYMVGNNRTALNAIARSCKSMGIDYRIHPDFLKGDAVSCGERIAKLALTEKKNNNPCMLIFGGEATVNVKKASGKGGRSQETALAALKDIKDAEGIQILCAGTDGIDGPTDAVGARVDAATYRLSREKDLNIFTYLDNHDSYNFHRQCNSLIKTGYTGTNVCDVAMALINC